MTSDIDGAFLAENGIVRVREALEAGHLVPASEELRSARIGAPIARPGAIVCVGQNYAAHAAESGDNPPETPIIFFKHPNTIVGPYDPVPLPPGSEKTDWEVELGVVIGKRTSYLRSIDEAMAHIAGYVVSNDVSERAFQLEQSGGQWSKGKNCANFNPLGPALVSASEVDSSCLGLRSWVNGEPRQDSNTKDMIFSVPYLIWHLSQYMVLEPGDLVNTGTPEGVALSGRFPYLRAGDVVEIEIDTMGRQRTQFEG
ncbi:fumarylacetoacetate hydrolase family protein [Nocardia australiensis]|uniref:fumarylacetoacetate hydrolase family protein n=1 Tax=Nocardia australiensis TaxID=2887191 RepID=UPI001D137DA5|nr:fumarylacetoacetate hydrolase family protein [Nocardia australiensis]